MFSVRVLILSFLFLTANLPELLKFKQELVSQYWDSLFACRSPVDDTVCVHLSHLMTKPTKWHVRPAKTQISLGIRPVWSESLLSTWRKLGSLATHWGHSEDSDQTGIRAQSFCWFYREVAHCVSILGSCLSHFLVLNSFFSSLHTPFSVQKILHV